VTVVGGGSYTPTLEFATLEITTTGGNGDIDAGVTLLQSGSFQGNDRSGSDGKLTANVAPGTYQIRGNGNVGTDPSVGDRAEVVENVTVNGNITYTPSLIFATVKIETQSGTQSIAGQVDIRKSGSYIGGDSTGNDGKLTANIAPGAYSVESDYQNTQLSDISTFGTQSTTLATIDYATNTVTFSQINTSKNTAPSTNIVYNPKSPTTGDTVGFDGSQSSDSDGSISFYEWDLDGDGTIEKTGQIVSKSFSTGGNYPIKLIVTDNDGATDSTQVIVSVSQQSSTPPGNSPSLRDLTGNGQAATDPDGDGVYEDINGDGKANLLDLQPFFKIAKPGGKSVSSPAALDFNGDGSPTLRDLRPFFKEISP
jgi:hypothetical protein